MRGKLRQKTPTIIIIGITPADAGKTLAENPGSGVVEDHPRGCGENEYIRRRSPLQKGSPPRMRGKRHEVVKHCIVIRITPADAGKTLEPSLRTL